MMTVSLLLMPTSATVFSEEKASQKTEETAFYFQMMEYEVGMKDPTVHMVTLKSAMMSTGFGTRCFILFQCGCLVASNLTRK